MDPEHFCISTSTGDSGQNLLSRYACVRCDCQRKHFLYVTINLTWLLSVVDVFAKATFGSKHEDDFTLGKCGGEYDIDRVTQAP